MYHCERTKLFITSEFMLLKNWGWNIYERKLWHTRPKSSYCNARLTSWNTSTVKSQQDFDPYMNYIHFARIKIQKIETEIHVTAFMWIIIVVSAAILGAVFFFCRTTMSRILYYWVSFKKAFVDSFATWDKTKVRTQMSKWILPNIELLLFCPFLLRQKDGPQYSHRLIDERYCKIGNLRTQKQMRWIFQVGKFLAPSFIRPTYPFKQCLQFQNVLTSKLFKKEVF